MAKVQLPPDPHRERNPQFPHEVPQGQNVPRRERKRQLQQEVPTRRAVPRQERDPKVQPRELNVDLLGPGTLTAEAVRGSQDQGPAIVREPLEFPPRRVESHAPASRPRREREPKASLSPRRAPYPADSNFPRDHGGTARRHPSQEEPPPAEHPTARPKGRSCHPRGLSRGSFSGRTTDQDSRPGWRRSCYRAGGL